MVGGETKNQTCRSAADLGEYLRTLLIRLLYLIDDFPPLSRPGIYLKQSEGSRATAALTYSSD